MTRLRLFIQQMLSALSRAVLFSRPPLLELEIRLSSPLLLSLSLSSLSLSSLLVNALFPTSFLARLTVPLCRVDLFCPEAQTKKEKPLLADRFLCRLGLSAFLTGKKLASKRQGRRKRWCKSWKCFHYQKIHTSSSTFLRVAHFLGYL
jgi:hypothetical protein